MQSSVSLSEFVLSELYLHGGYMPDKTYTRSWGDYIVIFEKSKFSIQRNQGNIECSYKPEDIKNLSTFLSSPKAAVFTDEGYRVGEFIFLAGYKYITTKVGLILYSHHQSGEQLSKLLDRLIRNRWKLAKKGWIESKLQQGIPIYNFFNKKPSYYPLYVGSHVTIGVHNICNGYISYDIQGIHKGQHKANVDDFRAIEWLQQSGAIALLEYKNWYGFSLHINSTPFCCLSYEDMLIPLSFSRRFAYELMMTIFNIQFDRFKNEITEYEKVQKSSNAKNVRKGRNHKNND